MNDCVLDEILWYLKLKKKSAEREGEGDLLEKHFLMEGEFV